MSDQETKFHFVQNVESDIPPIAGGKKGRFAKVSQQQAGLRNLPAPQLREMVLG
jgi:hypothetical protein